MSNKKENFTKKLANQFNEPYNINNFIYLGNKNIAEVIRYDLNNIPEAKGLGTEERLNNRGETEYINLSECICGMKFHTNNTEYIEHIRTRTLIPLGKICANKIVPNDSENRKICYGCSSRNRNTKKITCIKCENNVGPYYKIRSGNYKGYIISKVYEDLEYINYLNNNHCNDRNNQIHSVINIDPTIKFYNFLNVECLLCKSKYFEDCCNSKLCPKCEPKRKEIDGVFCKCKCRNIFYNYNNDKRCRICNLKTILGYVIKTGEYRGMFLSETSEEYRINLLENGDRFKLIKEDEYLDSMEQINILVDYIKTNYKKINCECGYIYCSRGNNYNCCKCLLGSSKIKFRDYINNTYNEFDTEKFNYCGNFNQFKIMYQVESLKPIKCEIETGNEFVDSIIPIYPYRCLCGATYKFPVYISYNSDYIPTCGICIKELLPKYFEKNICPYCRKNEINKKVGELFCYECINIIGPTYKIKNGYYKNKYIGEICKEEEYLKYLNESHHLICREEQIQSLINIGISYYWEKFTKIECEFCNRIFWKEDLDNHKCEIRCNVCNNYQLVKGFDDHLCKKNLIRKEYYNKCKICKSIVKENGGYILNTNIICEECNIKINSKMGYVVETGKYKGKYLFELDEKYLKITFKNLNIKNKKRYVDLTNQINIICEENLYNLNYIKQKCNNCGIFYWCKNYNNLCPKCLFESNFYNNLSSLIGEVFDINKAIFCGTEKITKLLYWDKEITNNICPCGDKCKYPRYLEYILYNGIFISICNICSEIIFGYSKQYLYEYCLICKNYKNKKNIDGICGNCIETPGPYYKVKSRYMLELYNDEEYIKSLKECCKEDKFIFDFYEMIDNLNNKNKIINLSNHKYKQIISLVKLGIKNIQWPNFEVKCLSCENIYYDDYTGIKFCKECRGDIKGNDKGEFDFCINCKNIHWNTDKNICRDCNCLTNYKYYIVKTGEYKGRYISETSEKYRKTLFKINLKVKPIQYENYNDFKLNHYKDIELEDKLNQIIILNRDTKYIKNKYKYFYKSCKFCNCKYWNKKQKYYDLCYKCKTYMGPHRIINIGEYSGITIEEVCNIDKDYPNRLMNETNKKIAEKEINEVAIKEIETIIAGFKLLGYLNPEINLNREYIIKAGKYIGENFYDICKTHVKYFKRVAITYPYTEEYEDLKRITLKHFDWSEEDCEKFIEELY